MHKSVKTLSRSPRASGELYQGGAVSAARELCDTRTVLSSPERCRQGSVKRRGKLSLRAPPAAQSSGGICVNNHSGAQSLPVCEVPGSSGKKEQREVTAYGATYSVEVLPIFSTVKGNRRRNRTLLQIKSADCWN
ncbi:hypothetical protein NDU88_001871 [Pleurodeles waltl]|uniref:Uncharacterized protein n=1 Tax=Pleurodeles waltl TaxID=8319 RepID=A0AAV7WNL2_PLEWA|nr:hypothetical protein NDU88_001871 [Pleurodeles waltl]